MLRGSGLIWSDLISALDWPIVYQMVGADYCPLFIWLANLVMSVVGLDAANYNG